jgi:flavin-dependent dehydrogenase
VEFDKCGKCVTDKQQAAMHMIKYHQHISMVPSNFVAVGDSWMRLNPVWGQGATMAMIQATSLDATLRAVSATSQSKLAIAPAYFKKIDTLLGGVWDDTKAHDYVYEACDTVPGDSRQIGAWSMVYERAIEKRATRGDVDLQRRMIGVTSWVLPPTDMITPGVLAKVALDWVLGR